MVLRARVWVVILFALSALQPKAFAVHKSAPEYPASKVKDLLAKVKKEKKNCSKPNYHSPSCRSKKLLLAMEALLESYLTLQSRADAELAQKKYLEERNEYLSTQATTLKDALKDLGSPTNFVPAKECYRPVLLKKLMIDLGITENGNNIYVKRPVPGNSGVCWTNSRRKREMTLNLCEYPLAITIETHGGSDRAPTKRVREYLFALNGCDLLSMHVTDTGTQGKHETYISYDQCMVQWNRRTADASMSPREVAFMEDTIGFCFREHLLPPRHDKNGRQNPQIRRPASPQ